MQRLIQWSAVTWLFVGAFAFAPTQAWAQAGAKDGKKGSEKVENRGRGPGMGKGAKPDKRGGPPHPGGEARPDRDHRSNAGRRPEPQGFGPMRGPRLGATPPGPADPVARAERRREHLEKVRKRRRNLDKSPKHKAAMKSGKAKKGPIADEQRKHVKRMTKIRRLMVLASERGDRPKAAELRELQKMELKRHAAFMKKHGPKKKEPNKPPQKDGKEAAK